MNTISEHEIVTKLIELTNGKKIDWYYLDSDFSLYDNLNLAPRKTFQGTAALLNEYAALNDNKLRFDVDNSFYSCLSSNYLVLYVTPPSSNKEILAERMSLLLVPKTYRSIKEINNVEDLIRLHTIIKSGFPSAESIIEDIFKI